MAATLEGINAEIANANDGRMASNINCAPSYPSAEPSNASSAPIPNASRNLFSVVDSTNSAASQPMDRPAKRFRSVSVGEPNAPKIANGAAPKADNKKANDLLSDFQSIFTLRTLATTTDAMTQISICKMEPS